MIQELEKIDPIAWWNAMVSWCANYLFQANTIYEGIIIAISFIFGIILYRVLRKPMQNAISKADIPYRAKKIANNIRKLLFPLITLAVLFFITSIASSELVGVDVSLINGMMKVLLAWVVIRIIVQFIDNNAVRNIFAMSIWCVAALSIFGMLGAATQTLDAIGFSIGDVRLSALTVIKTAFYLFALLYFATFTSSFAERRVLKSKGLTRSSQVLISKIIRVTLVVFALLMGITSSGIDLSLFTVFGGAIGLGIGFGLQKGISNLFSGILLLVDKSIKPGDVIELENGTFGWVNHMAHLWYSSATLQGTFHADHQQKERLLCVPEIS